MPILTLKPQWILGSLPQVHEQNLSLGRAGNYETVKFMKRVAADRAGHPLVRSLATRIVQGLPSMAYLDEARAIGEWVWKNVRYVQDPAGIEQLKDPVLMIEETMRGEGHGDCDDMALLTATLLGAIGHYPNFRVVRYHSDFGPYNHIYVTDYQKNGISGEKKRIVLDCIVKVMPIGFEVPHRSGREIPVFEPA